MSGRWSTSSIGAESVDLAAAPSVTPKKGTGTGPILVALLGCSVGIAIVANIAGARNAKREGYGS